MQNSPEFDKLMAKPHSNNFIVDIGASYNSHFLKYPCRGLLFDIDSTKIMRIPNDNLYHKINKKITPENVCSVLNEFNVPKNFKALNLDIDSYDLFVLINLLKNYQPEIIITETNEKIPPPINFSVIYNETIKWEIGHLYGYSINCLIPILEHFNYKIHAVEFADVILVKGSPGKYDLHSIYKKEAAKWLGTCGWNKDVEYWQKMKYEDLIEEIIHFFPKNKRNNFVIGEECNTLISEYLKN